MSALEKIICKLDTRRGAPMGRYTVGERPKDKTIFDARVNICSGGYDAGGAYWGLGKELRVSYTKDLEYINFYRVE